MAIKEQIWTTVKDWTTEAGLRAIVMKCEWSPEIKKIAPSLTDFHTGYVEYDSDESPDDLSVHGGITFHGTIALRGDTVWIGFDLNHIGDEHIPDQAAYAEDECENLAQQIVDMQS